ncbi:sensor histidine kinase [Deinococcus hopiensis]|uniref:histidine kinase n=1 Tax=Deinococcus hopiensis KR-140 TaxID=695939 RepID=A0A1W1UDY0_9DEIO|nr:HAMP domain-containing sensor histidine kinase [Deinococcus hopiensis]SMB79249.1 two-component system, OmpR family, sensor histidine kinase BaeS [Deinococcus hopiensis KR-140]
MNLHPARSLQLRLVLWLAGASLLSHLLFAALTPTILLQLYRQELVQERTERTATLALTHYRRAGSWRGFAFPAPAVSSASPPARTRGSVRPPLLLDPRGNVVAHGAGEAPARVDPRAVRTRPLTLNGQTVGYLVPGSPPPNPPEERAVISAMSRSIFLAALSRLLTVVLLTALLTRGVLRSLERLTQAARQFTLGQPYRPVPVRGQDEVAVLAETFNEMQAEIARADAGRRRMLSDIAHDLSTPLTIVHGYVQAMASGRLPPTPERLATVQDELDLMRNLVEDLRFLSLADAGEVRLSRESLRPGDVLDALARAFAQRAERQGVALKLEVAPGLPSVSLDPSRVRQALGNLTSNALNHTGQGGEITLTVRARPPFLEFEVRDTGLGIPADALPLVFDRFYRVAPERSGTGTGLGLSIALSIAEMHGGTVTLESTEGVGTRATLRLPLQEGTHSEDAGTAKLTSR